MAFDLMLVIDVFIRCALGLTSKLAVTEGELTYFQSHGRSANVEGGASKR